MTIEQLYSLFKKDKTFTECQNPAYISSANGKVKLSSKNIELYVHTKQSYYYISTLEDMFEVCDNLLIIDKDTAIRFKD